MDSNEFEELLSYHLINITDQDADRIVTFLSPIQIIRFRNKRILDHLGEQHNNAITATTTGTTMKTTSEEEVEKEKQKQQQQHFKKPQRQFPPPHPLHNRISTIAVIHNLFHLVLKLHELGYEKLRIYPGFSMSRLWWRCWLAAKDNGCKDPNELICFSTNAKIDDDENENENEEAEDSTDDDKNKGEEDEPTTKQQQQQPKMPTLHKKNSSNSTKNTKIIQQRARKVSAMDLSSSMMDGSSKKNFDQFVADFIDTFAEEMKLAKGNDEEYARWYMDFYKTCIVQQQDSRLKVQAGVPDFFHRSWIGNADSKKGGKDDDDDEKGLIGKKYFRMTGGPVAKYQYPEGDVNKVGPLIGMLTNT